MRSIIIAISTLFFSFGAIPAAEPKRPNVVILLTDDQGYGDLSCHGSPVLKTPNLDKIHSESVRFTDFHTSPMCTPSRGQLMSGVDSLRNGAACVSAGRAILRRGIPTMADIFAANGYKTAMFGKWHLGDSYPFRPHDRGFGEAVYNPSWGITSLTDYWQNDYFDPTLRHNGKPQHYTGYCTDLLFDLTKKWIKERKQAGEPFFVYLPTNAPHGPFWVAEKYSKMFANMRHAGFFGMIANIDENVGTFDAFLKEEKLFDDTIFIFMSDNGEGSKVAAALFNAGLRGMKRAYYEGGHRDPCFVRWPNGNLRKPCDVDALTEIQDILPTLIDLCGLKKPANAKFDGASLADLLRGKADALPDRILVVQYAGEPNEAGGNGLKKNDCAVMWNKWRLVHATELYDLKTDPGQATDVAVKHPDIVKKLRDHYEAWWKEVEPGLREYEPISIGAQQENPVTLTSAEWNGIGLDDQEQLRAGQKANGAWRVLVERDGIYEIELRRWPKEADIAMAAAAPKFEARVGSYKAGVALPIAKARLKIADLDETKPVGKDDKGIVFEIKLKAGTKLPMQSWLYDADGKELCGAYFAYVRRK